MESKPIAYVRNRSCPPGKRAYAHSPARIILFLPSGGKPGQNKKTPFDRFPLLIQN